MLNYNDVLLHRLQELNLFNHYEISHTLTKRYLLVTIENQVGIEPT